MHRSISRVVKNAVRLRHRITCLLMLAMVSTFPAHALIRNGANAENVLGKIASYPDDTAVDYLNRFGVPSPIGMFNPRGIAIDSINHRLFIAESNNNRVLVFTLNNDNTVGSKVPTNVLGQTSYFTNSFAHTQSGLNGPYDVAYDSTNQRLFVAEGVSNRVKVFDLSGGITNGMNAAYILGQTTWTGSSSANTQSGLNFATALTYDSTNQRLFVSEYSGNRVKVFDVASITNGENAAYVLGQANFTSSSSANTQAGMNVPTGLSYDSVNQRLFVSENGGNRVKVFNLSGGISNGMNAVNVLGQGAVPTVSGYTVVDYNGSVLLLRQDGTDLMSVQINGVITPIIDNLGSPLTFGYAAGWQPLAAETVGGTNRVAWKQLSDGYLHYWDLNASWVYGSSGPVVAPSSGTGLQIQSDFQIDASGNPLPLNPWTGSSSANTQSGLNQPQGLAYDGTNQRLFVGERNRVKVFDVASITDGENAINVLGQADFTGSSGANTQSGLRADITLAYDNSNQRLFATEYNGNRVKVFDVASITNGENAIDLLGQYSSASSTSTVNYTKQGKNNTPNEQSFSSAIGIVMDRLNHRLFVVDDSVERILVFNLNIDNTLPDRTADYVLGQPDFSSTGGSDTQSGLNSPRGLAYDSTNQRLFVSEYGGSRVKVFDVASITNGENAINVLGQTTWTGNATADTQSGLNNPNGLAYDSTNQRLFVSEFGGNRVKVFDVTSITDGENAINVLGQTTFTGASAANTQSGLNAPSGLAYDSTNQRLFVAEFSGNRVKVFDVTSITDGENAVNVLGQTTFTGSGFATTQSRLAFPTDLAYDITNHRLFVAEPNRNRVMAFDLSRGITNGMNAVNVLGQSIFTSSSSATTQSGLSFPNGVFYDPGTHKLFVSDYSNGRIMIFDGTTMSSSMQSISPFGP